MRNLVIQEYQKCGESERKKDAALKNRSEGKIEIMVKY